MHHSTLHARRRTRLLLRKGHHFRLACETEDPHPGLTRCITQPCMQGGELVPRDITSTSASLARRKIRILVYQMYHPHIPFTKHHGKGHAKISLAQYDYPCRHPSKDKLDLLVLIQISKHTSFNSPILQVIFSQCSILDRYSERKTAPRHEQRRSSSDGSII